MDDSQATELKEFASLPQEKESPAQLAAELRDSPRNALPQPSAVEAGILRWLNAIPTRR